MSKPLLKICCIKSGIEADLALQAGADFLGFVSEMPNGPGVLTHDEIASLIASLPPRAKSVLLTSKTTSREILEQQKFVGSWGVQLVNHVDPLELVKLRDLDGGLTLFQVVHVVDKSSIDIARMYYDLCDFLLLDSGSSNAKDPSLGGTGRVHDWQISRDICRESPIPVLLAGGIKTTNIDSAFHCVSPAGFDLCSGLRSNDELNENKLTKFMYTFSALGVEK